jgi:hypothetical protein
MGVEEVLIEVRTETGRPHGHGRGSGRGRVRLGLTSLRYQTLGAMIEAIGLPRDKLCTYCWSGESLREEA